MNGLQGLNRPPRVNRGCRLLQSKQQSQRASVIAKGPHTAHGDDPLLPTRRVPLTKTPT